MNSAISTYDDNMKNSSTSYDLPVLLDKDWDKILSNISMTVFMQGLPCGSKYFNDYTTVTSDKSNQFVDKNNLVFTKIVMMIIIELIVRNYYLIMLVILKIQL